MPHSTPDFHKKEGIKMYLVRTRTQAQIMALADQCFAAGSTDESIIISAGADGSQSQAEVSFPAWLLQLALEEVIQEQGWSFPAATRSLVTVPTWNNTWSAP